ncbi:MAG: type II toxin-antitoxin system VapC family toxin [Lapillicoccus sp.]
MTELLVDTSVLLKWFHREGESELGVARALRSAHVTGAVEAHILDLAVYEMGNVLVRALGWEAEPVSAQLRDLLTILGTPLVMSLAWLDRAARLAVEHRLTFCDASWAAAAAELDVTLVSADQQLLRTGLAESPTHVVQRLRLPSA